jgi:hypothetical protein
MASITSVKRRYEQNQRRDEANGFFPSDTTIRQQQQTNKPFLKLIRAIVSQDDSIKKRSLQICSTFELENELPASDRAKKNAAFAFGNALTRAMFIMASIQQCIQLCRFAMCTCKSAGVGYTLLQNFNKIQSTKLAQQQQQ